ncbi:MAG TPA: peptide deformylase [Myxococcota bacterium]|nr:peptide deformylase [Myxococcota bacterium]HNZ04130.1 peptide deformylase [Myxococcota bacterium]HPB50339.1 peptide deformylase [Myxococcota bacterium]HQP95421.1 peptide deformylase [Myxococcota bacterium]
MAVLRICRWPDEVLTRKGVEVGEVDDGIRKLIDDMAETMYAGKGIGLAAPQVGKSLRIAVIDVPGDEEFQPTGLVALVNPRIVAQDGSVTMDEGCLSFPGIEVNVKRAFTVTVEYTDRDGRPQKIEVSDLAAICVQHELDHLDGVTMIDRVGPIRRKLALRDYQKSCRGRAADQGNS